MLKRLRLHRICSQWLQLRLRSLDLNELCAKKSTNYDVSVVKFWRPPCRFSFFNRFYPPPSKILVAPLQISSTILTSLFCHFSLPMLGSNALKKLRGFSISDNLHASAYPRAGGGGSSGLEKVPKNAYFLANIRKIFPEAGGFAPWPPFLSISIPIYFTNCHITLFLSQY